MMFLSPKWLSAWVDLANEDPRFRQAGSGWNGVVGLEVRPTAGMAGPSTYLRLDGSEGRWTSQSVGVDAGLLDGATFTLSADFVAWKAVIQQEVEPVRALIQGRVRVHGQLSQVLRWTRALQVMTELAGRLDTTFPDEVEP